MVSSRVTLAYRKIQKVYLYYPLRIERMHIGHIQVHSLRIVSGKIELLEIIS